MKTLIKIEEIAFFALGLYLFSQLDYKWWQFMVLLFIPDLAMIGYVVNTKVGAIVYNFFHLRALWIFIYIVRAILNSQLTMLTGIMFFAHSSMDRIFGFGLKYSDDFKHTHL